MVIGGPGLASHDRLNGVPTTQQGHLQMSGHQTTRGMKRLKERGIGLYSLNIVPGVL